MKPVCCSTWAIRSRVVSRRFTVLTHLWLAGDGDRGGRVGGYDERHYTRDAGLAKHMLSSRGRMRHRPQRARRASRYAIVIVSSSAIRLLFPLLQVEGGDVFEVEWLAACSVNGVMDYTNASSDQGN
jgi:hypothetical protein